MAGGVEGRMIGELALQVEDVAEAVRWYQQHVPRVKVLFADEHWAFIEAARGTRLAFVLRSPHPSHLSFRVEPDELRRLAKKHGQPVLHHADGTLTAMVPVPGDGPVELIAYPPEQAGHA